MVWRLDGGGVVTSCPDALVSTAAVCLTKIIFVNAGHPFTSSPHYVTVAPKKRVKMVRYLLSNLPLHANEYVETHIPK